jgi:hypothetical protein
LTCCTCSVPYFTLLACVFEQLNPLAALAAECRWCRTWWTCCRTPALLCGTWRVPAWTASWTATRQRQVRRVGKGACVGALETPGTGCGAWQSGCLGSIMDSNGAAAGVQVGELERGGLMLLVYVGLKYCRLAVVCGTASAACSLG